MIKESFPISSEADLKKVVRKVRAWANTKRFGISWSVERTKVNVTFFEETLHATDGAIAKARASLCKILKKFVDAPTEKSDSARMKSKRKKLFVWTDFCPDYTSGLAFAVAKDEAQARKLVEKAQGYSPGDWGTLTVYPLSKSIAFAVSGGG